MALLAYRITNTVSGKFYIGITSRGLRGRFNNHWAEACNGSKTILHRAMRKYGKGAFEIEPVAIADSWDELLMLERGLIYEFRATDRKVGYNLTAGGDGTRGYCHSVEGRAQMSAARRGRRLSPEWRAKIGDAHRGTKKSPEAIAKTAAAHRGRKRSAETCRRISEARRGCVIAPETVEKIVAANRGRRRSQEVRAKFTVIQRERANKVEIDGVFKSLSEWAELSGLKHGTVVTRYHRGKRGADLIAPLQSPALFKKR